MFDNCSCNTCRITFFMTNINWFIHIKNDVLQLVHFFPVLLSVLQEAQRKQSLGVFFDYFICSSDKIPSLYDLCVGRRFNQSFTHLVLSRSYFCFFLVYLDSYDKQLQDIVWTNMLYHGLPVCTRRSSTSFNQWIIYLTGRQIVV